jgi:hypothetical protein
MLEFCKLFRLALNRHNSLERHINAKGEAGGQTPVDKYDYCSYYFPKLAEQVRICLNESLRLAQGLFVECGQGDGNASA